MHFFSNSKDGLPEQSKEKLFQYFLPRVRRNKSSHKAVGWISPASQQKRFRLALEAGIYEGDSVLDVGCGTGDFYAFLSKHINSFKYVGVDICSDMIEEAQQQYPEARFMDTDILKTDWEKEFDVVVGIGVYNVETGDNETTMIRMMQHMYQISRRRVVVTMTEDDNFLGTGIYSFPHEKMAEAAEEIAPNVRLRRKPEENHFALYLTSTPEASPPS